MSFLLSHNNQPREINCNEVPITPFVKNMTFKSKFGARVHVINGTVKKAITTPFAKFAECKIYSVCVFLSAEIINSRVKFSTDMNKLNLNTDLEYE